MTSPDAILSFTTEIAERAGELIVELRSSKKLDMDFKRGVELVTNADVAADKLITDAIRSRFPDHEIMAEESAPDLEKLKHLDKPLWIIDPIDGTVNYAHYHNQVAVSIAYAVRGQVQVGVVYSPFQAEMFTAVRGQGSWLNDQPLQCSDVKELSKSIIATGFPYEKQSQLPTLINRLHGILKECADVRRLGSAALDICWVAMGRLDGYYETVSPWDFAAAQLIAREAGALCGHFIDPPTNTTTELFGENLLISNPHLYKDLKSILASVK